MARRESPHAIDATTRLASDAGPLVLALRRAVRGRRRARHRALHGGRVPRRAVRAAARRRGRGRAERSVAGPFTRLVLHAFGAVRHPRDARHGLVLRRPGRDGRAGPRRGIDFCSTAWRYRGVTGRRRRRSSSARSASRSSAAALPAAPLHASRVWYWRSRSAPIYFSASSASCP